MPTNSARELGSIPPLDLWSFLFDRLNREFPDDHAVYVDIADTGATEAWTYGEVRASSERIGKSLRQDWGWEKGDVMAVFSPNCADIGSLIFGVLWAGGIICPINNLSKTDELASYLKSSGAKGLATHQSCLQVAQDASRAAGISLDRIVLIGAPHPRGTVKHISSMKCAAHHLEKMTVNPSTDLAFLVYSSGTTGLPKGVMLTHENMIANILQNNTMDEGNTNWESDRTLGFLPMYHIYGIAVLVLLPVYQAITVYIMQRFDLEQFCRNIAQHKITVTFVVPPVALLLAKHSLVDSYDLTSLRMMHSSAAPLAVDIIEMLYGRLKIPIKQGYGLSEASPGVATQAWAYWNKTIGSVGQLLPSVSIKFMVGEKEVPVGETGEICLKGPNIFKGYYKNPEATAQSIDTAGWYHTGDVGYIDRHNNIFITDRMKELIKYNGYQVSPAQLEGLLQGHPAVSDVAVIGVYSTERATELPRAYIIPAAGYLPGSELGREIIDWLDKKVASHKRLRGGITFVDAIPKSAAGKLLRRVLVERSKTEAQSGGQAKL